MRQLICETRLKSVNSTTSCPLFSIRVSIPTVDEITKVWRTKYIQMNISVNKHAVKNTYIITVRVQREDTKMNSISILVCFYQQ